MNRVRAEDKFIETHPLPEVAVERDGKITITLTENSYNYFAIIRLTKPDKCVCGCSECRTGHHRSCESDGQSCYYDASRRLDDGIWNRMPVVVEEEEGKQNNAK